MRSGLHGACTKPAPRASHPNQASQRRRDADCVCTSVGEQVTPASREHAERIQTVLVLCSNHRATSVSKGRNGHHRYRPSRPR